jgi:peroxiredoxin
MRKLIAFIFLFHYFFSLSASTVVINGKAPGAEGLTLRLMKYADPISYKMEKIAETTVKENADFNLEIDVKNTFFCFISIDYYWSAPLYIEAGKNYYIKIDSADFHMKNDNNLSFLDEKRIFFSVNHEHPKDLNNRIFNFNAAYSEFVVKNFNVLGSHSGRKLLSEFKEECLSRYLVGDDIFMQNYIIYRLASLEYSMNLKSKKTIFMEYLSKQKIHPENDEYMAFFHQFYQKHFERSPLLNYREIQGQINAGSSLFSILDSLGKDSTLRNEVIREMVLIKSLGEAYKPYSDFNPEKILSLLKDIQKSSKFPEHQNAAANMIEEKTKLQIGYPAPDFQAKDINDSLYSLKDFHGKWLYLGFWQTNSTKAIAEMEALKNFYPEYKDSIQFVMISTDMEYLHYYYFMQKNQIPFPVLHFNHNIDCIENYHAKISPLFVMIDPDGNIFRYPALSPGEGVENMFYWLKNRNNLPPDYSRVGKW